MSLPEAVAVLLAIAYLLLAIRQNIWCWPAAIAGSGIYVVLMYRAGLYMESALQLFYIAMAVYGWLCWRPGQQQAHSLPVTSWPLAFHALSLGIIAVLTMSSGYLLTSYTSAALPYLDSFTTWGAIVTTWMVARKVLQNWQYWFVIDSVSVYLYSSRGLPLTALLFCVYLVLIIFGYRAWRLSMSKYA
ncbi:MAG: nicotinamide mononucleotide transporter [Gammaproteobacteria bacterium]|nr:nicotinamide mononucleotide transporter [Gammaproteobacteria bacterium]MCP4090121.1 nicotinamide mononucleotide transporter [Gammaproteobacteria bacterium]MCP4276989.1 nicotinamide mononucleotide transporter [Gammaproteobacteria bacterium]MCP4831761.1 nicotinamide mononucleotide transporter [Gammaproteobacteria bacterium]MCP4929484.1 nicotinamide mononucleotide transporter [Gammaproteobacteria bacterium]